MKPIPKTDRRVVNIFESVFTPIQSNGKPDGEVLQLYVDNLFGSGFYYCKMAPGAAMLPHKQILDAQFFIVQRDLRDDDDVASGP